MDFMQRQVLDGLNSITPKSKESILSDFEKFQSYLTEKVAMAEKLGLGDDKLTKATEIVANYLANHEDPKNSEEHLLQSLWKVGDKEEQHALASMLLKMVRH